MYIPLLNSSFAQTPDDGALALLALSHTTIEHQLYTAMLSRVLAVQTAIGAFTVQSLRQTSGVRSAAAVKRGLLGLAGKLSVEEHHAASADGVAQGKRLFHVFLPQEIFARRYVASLQSKPENSVLINAPREQSWQGNLSEVIKRYNISCREAEVALFCVQGLTNGEIARRLHIGEPTVKFHLRNIFTKCGVKRRTELVSHLLTQPSPAKQIAEVELK